MSDVAPLLSALRKSAGTIASWNEVRGSLRGCSCMRLGNGGPKLHAFALLLTLLSAPLHAGEPFFPGASWETPSPDAPEGWSAERLRIVEERLQATKPTAVMVVHDGRVVVAWGDIARTVNIRSVRNSMLSALYGVAVAEGRIDLRRTLAGVGIHDNEPRLTSEEKEATVRDLLMSRSGIYHGAVFDTSGLSTARPARGSYLPGAFWYYNNWDFNALGTIYTRLMGESIFEAFERRIARLIGMEDFRGSRDGHLIYESVSQHPVYAMLLSARDLARFGLLYLNDGRWAGKQVVPSSWVKESTKRWSDASNGLGYGYMWWELPSDLGLGGAGFAAMGNDGQAVAVIPSRRLVVVQTADRHDSPVEFRPAHFIELLRLVVAAGSNG
jgi:CubicO group peptidase (beta-lactamase class C family)